MNELRLNGVEVVLSELSLQSFKAAACRFLLPITPANRDAMLAEFHQPTTHLAYSGLKLSGISDMSFLSDFPGLLYLEIADQKRVDVRQLQCLTNLRGLRIDSPAAGIDFRWFPELEYFVGDWHVDNGNFGECRELRQIRCWQFKPRSADLSDLSALTRLESLHLVKTSIESLSGIEALEDLRYLEIAYAPQLQSLEALAAGECGVRELRFQNAKKIASYAPLAAIPRLRRLKLFACAPMPNLGWTRGMNHLDSFSFVETNVEDGDLSPLLELPRLEYVGTMDKKHYNYKFGAINEILSSRRQETHLA